MTPQPPRQRARLLGVSAAVILVPVVALALAGSLPSQELTADLGATEVRTEAPVPPSTIALGREAVPDPQQVIDPKGVAVVAPPTTTTTTTPPTTAVAEPEVAPEPVSVPSPSPATTTPPAPARPRVPAPAPTPAPAPAGSVSANLDAIARCESGGNPDAYNPAGYYGAFQFALATWHGLGMSGDPRDYTYAQQKYVALALYNRSGYAPWPHCASSLGLL